jgi:Immunity protein 17
VNWVGLFFMAAGGFSIVGAVQDWEWFLQSRKARLFVTLMGRKGARIFYGILGLALVVLGAAFLAGIIEPGPKR